MGEAGTGRHAAHAILLAAWVAAIGCGGTSKPLANTDGASAAAGTGAAGTGVDAAVAGASGAAGSAADAGADVAAVTAPLFVDGTRLVARWYSFAGTPPLFAGIYDRQEKTRCAFGQATDGQLRCLPEATLTPPADPPDRWAAGTQQVGEDPTTRVRSHWITSADGGRFPNRFAGELYDAKAARACTPVPRTTGQPSETRCLPSTTPATGHEFADPACAEPLAIKLVETDMPAMIIFPDGALHTVGELFKGQVYSNYAQGACQPGQPAAPFMVRVGAALPSDAVPLVDVVSRGTGRLTLRMLESEGVSLAAVPFSDAYAPRADLRAPYVDGTLNLACQPVRTVDGEARCLPGDATYVPANSVTAFADPACTLPVLNTTSLTAVILRPRDAANPVAAIEVRRLATMYTATAYTMVGGTCSENRRLTGRRLLDTIPFSEYARLDASPAAP